MIFDTNQWKSYADLHLRLYRVTDEQGEVFLLLTGPEPDVQWERVAAALLGLIEQLGRAADRQRARHPDGGAAHPARSPSPRTPPTPSWSRATAAGSTGSRCRPASPGCWSSGSANSTVRRWVSPPTFRTTWPRRAFPEATLTLTRSLNQATGLAVPLEPLEKASAANLADIAEEMQGSTRGAGAGGDPGAAVRRLQAESPTGCPAPRRSPPSSSGSWPSGRRTSSRRRRVSRLVSGACRGARPSTERGCVGGSIGSSGAAVR